MASWTMGFVHGINITKFADGLADACGASQTGNLRILLRFTELSTGEYEELSKSLRAYMAIQTRIINRLKEMEGEDA